MNIDWNKSQKNAHRLERLLCTCKVHISHLLINGCGKNYKEKHKVDKCHTEHRAQLWASEEGICTHGGARRRSRQHWRYSFLCMSKIITSKHLKFHSTSMMGRELEPNPLDPWHPWVYRSWAWREKKQMLSLYLQVEIEHLGMQAVQRQAAETAITLPSPPSVSVFDIPCLFSPCQDISRQIRFDTGSQWSFLLLLLNKSKKKGWSCLQQNVIVTPRDSVDVL